MIRILLLHPTPTRGGFTAVVAEAKELCRRAEFDVTVVSTRGPRINELPFGCSVECLDHPLTSVRGVRQLRCIAARVRPDVVHLHGRQAALIARIALQPQCRQHVLYSPHGSLTVDRSIARRFGAELAERALLGRTTSILCVSHHEVTEWSSRDLSAQIRYLPNNIWPEERASSNDVSGEKLDDNDWSRTVLVPSGYDPVKRVEVVVKAIALLPEPRPNVVVVGAIARVDYRNRMIALAAGLGVSRNIRFDDEIVNIHAALRDAALVILPSFSEGMPIIGLEAIAAGARVAWSRISGHIELFGESGAPFWNAGELAHILGSDDYAGASVASRQTWLTDYHRQAEEVRSEYWDEVEAVVHGG